jgi:hypothetical protein
VGKSKEKQRRRKEREREREEKSTVIHMSARDEYLTPEQ